MSDAAAAWHLPPSEAAALAEARVANPFALLGPHRYGRDVIVRAYLPGAENVEAIDTDGELLARLQPGQVGGLFGGTLKRDTRYLLRIHWPGGVIQETEDPYSFGLLLGELDLHLIAEGKHFELARCLGAQVVTIDGVRGVRFAVWAPNAQRVSVIGDFNSWDGRRHPMRKRIEAGVWEIFIPRLGPGVVYKYELLGPHGALPHRADPVGRQVEPLPGKGSVVADPAPFEWHDQLWLQQRAERQSVHAPISIYEVHAMSWRRVAEEGWRSLSWDELADQLVEYVATMGFTHIELLPITAHPFRGSWGYQPLGLFAPDAGLGEPVAFKRFVNRCHERGIGVILDWVPAHFPSDAHGLARFDGTALYEHEDPREGYHQDWNTLIYNLDRNEVHGFLLASALHWLEEYHVDGLRVDAVASMLYRDYSRREGEWIPNRYGGRENLEAVAFLRHLNQVVEERCPGAITIAEESTAWPGVTHPVHEGGLGFCFKWNMGWMHDTLSYMSEDPIHRRWHHDKITFGLVYAFSEKFVLPLSHDEVVHGKGSLVGKMSGDRWQRFASLRAYLAFMWAHSGKKLLFMGGELAQEHEWNHDAQLDWGALHDLLHAGQQLVVQDLNRHYRTLPALHTGDCDVSGFRWLVGDDSTNSVYAFYRAATDDSEPPVMVVCNLTPVPHSGYRLGVPRIGRWRELLNTDAVCYGGSGVGNGGAITAVDHPCHGQAFSAELILPPLATLYFVHEPEAERDPNQQ